MIRCFWTKTFAVLLAIVQLVSPGFAAEKATVPKWQALYQGIEFASWTLSEPRQVAAYLLRIDLQAKGVSLESTPGNGDADGETDALKTSSFLRRHGFELAINAGPFDPVSRKEGSAQDVIGLHMHQGRIISPRAGNEPTLAIYQNGTARVVRGGADVGKAWTAVSGFSTVLWQGKVVPHKNDPLHPRTAAGVSADGRFLILMIVDGRQPGYSLGATCEELGAWLRDAGCENGLNLDGGGSTTLVRERRSKGEKETEFLNRPINGLLERERVVGSHLGIHALPLEAN